MMSQVVGKYENNVKKLVISRLEQMPDNHRIHIGNMGKFDKSQLIQHVKDESDVGDTIIKMELYYLRSLKDM